MTAAGGLSYRAALPWAPGWAVGDRVKTDMPTGGGELKLGRTTNTPGIVSPF